MMKTNKKGQISLEFLASFALLLALLAILGSYASSHFSSAQKSITQASQINSLSLHSLNLGIAYCATEHISTGEGGKIGKNIGIGQNTIFYAGGEKVSTINPGGGGEYAAIQNTIPN